MKHLALVGFILLAMVPNTDTTKELITIEKGFNSALVRSDWKAVERMYADDLIFTNADGSVTHKLDEVAAVRSGDIKMDSIEMSDERVQDFGDVAVTTGEVVEKGRYKTADLSGTYRFTDVWAKRNGRWQLVAGQETRYIPARDNTSGSTLR
jgi:ketosteroid isomerase-like protein